MATHFADKIKTIIELLAKKSYDFEYILDHITTTLPEGFYVFDNKKKIISATDKSIISALKDARYWGFIEIQENICSIAEIGRKALTSNKVSSQANFELSINYAIQNVIRANTFHEPIDIRGIQSCLRTMPHNTIPDIENVWTALKSQKPLLFNKDVIPRSRIGQLLSLLSEHGSGSIATPRRTLYFDTEDDRYKSIEKE